MRHSFVVSRVRLVELKFRGRSVGALHSDPIADAAGAANVQAFNNSTVVSGYLQSAYHRERIDVAARLFFDELSRAPEGQILEVGSNSEALLAVLSGRSWIASDIAFDALSGGGGNRICLDAARPLPLRTQSLAGIVSGEFIEHIYDVHSMICEFFRVLRPGGVLVLTTPNLANLQDRFRFLVGASPRQVNALHPYLKLHIRPFTASSLRDLLSTCGFEVIDLRSNYVGWQWKTGRWLEWRRPAKLMPSIGGSLIVSARRPSR